MRATRTARRLIQCGLCALVLAHAATLSAQPGPGSVNLAVFTSAIDLTGQKVVVRVSAPDSQTGVMKDIPTPPGIFGPKFRQLLASPISAQFDNYWNGALDPATGKTVRTLACDDTNGIKVRVAAEVAKHGNQAHDISCSLATNGEIVAKQIGSTVIIGYLLRNNAVSFQSTSSGTCNPNNGTVFCPNDPRFTVKFAIEIVTVLRAGGICELFASDGDAFIQGASFESHNAAAEIARFFAGQRFVAGEVAMTNTVKRQKLPLDGILNEVRTGDLCAKRLPGADRMLFAFRDFQPEIDPRRGLVLHATHGGILAPIVDVPQPTAAGTLPAPSVPSFTRPMIATAQPLVKAGDAVAVSGQHFPTSLNLATALPVGLSHDSRNPSVILGAPPGGVCFGGGGTDLEFGKVGGPLQVDRLPGTLQGACVSGGSRQGLQPGTSYQFRARDCDPFTCSPWSAVRKVTTALVDRSVEKVLVDLDRTVALGGATIDAAGNFTTPVTIPAGTAAGTHTIRASTRGSTAVAEVVVQVVPAGVASRGTMMVVGVLHGESGCPNHPISSVETDDTFLIFGAGFSPGLVSVNLDNVSGQQLGTASVRADGSICQRVRSPASNFAGPHAVIAVQGGAQAARMNINFVVPSGVH